MSESGGEMAASARTGRPEAPATRTAPELAVLLLELARVVKARRFYGPGDGRLAAVFERTVRTWRTHLERSGPLALEVRSDGFREVGAGGVLHHERLDELRGELGARGVRAVHFDADMDGDALAGFAELLASAVEPARDGRSFAARLRARVPIGIRAESDEPEPAPQPEPVPVAPPEPELEIAAAPATPAAADPEALGPAPALEADPEPTEPTLPTEPAEPELEAELEKPLAEVPVAANASLPSLLAELDACASVPSYLELARRATLEAERRGDPASALLVMERFAQHVESKRDRELEVAQTFLRAFARGPRLGWLLDRVATGDGSEQLRATQIVAMLGEEIAGELFDRLTQLPDRVQRERIEPLLVALGEQIVPELLQRMQRPDAPAVRSAAHVAGLLQHPATVDRLAQLAFGPDAALRDEACRALVRIGSDDAVEALARGLRAPQPALALSAAQQLGATGSARAVAPLGHALERALEAKHADLAREIVRALGRTGRAEVSPFFASLMRRKAGFGGRWLRELKVAAASALATVPGDQAVALLAEALAMRDDALRRAAQRALDRRAQAVTRAAPSRPVA